jgi:hypothetical protein
MSLLAFLKEHVIRPDTKFKHVAIDIRLATEDTIVFQNTLRAPLAKVDKERPSLFYQLTDENESIRSTYLLFSSVFPHPDLLNKETDLVKIKTRALKDVAPGGEDSYVIRGDDEHVSIDVILVDKYTAGLFDGLRMAIQLSEEHRSIRIIVQDVLIEDPQELAKRNTRWLQIFESLESIYCTAESALRKQIAETVSKMLRDQKQHTTTSPPVPHISPIGHATVEDLNARFSKSQ